jgi:hypothetical protein
MLDPYPDPQPWLKVEAVGTHWKSAISISRKWERATAFLFPYFLIDLCHHGKNIDNCYDRAVLESFVATPRFET